MRQRSQFKVITKKEPIELKKRLEEVRLLESRRSARLADQDRDTDFARLADMGGDRRRTSHSIEVPFSFTPQQNSRKRPPSYTHDLCGDKYNEEDINACKAAMILMNLSNSPKSPKNGEKWLGSSPGSSSASWSSGSSSPPLSDDGHAMLHSSSNMMLHDAAAATARIRTTSVSTSDEGIVVDFKEEVSRKKRGNKLKFKCMWKGCNIIEATQSRIKGHIRHVHLGESGEEESGEEDFYYEEEDDDEGKAPSPTSPPTHQHAPPTLSHRDMARPPHEDPEYQRQVVGNFKQGRLANQYHNNNNGKSMYHHLSGQTKQQQIHQNNIIVSCIPTSPLANYKNTWPSTSANATNDLILSQQSVNSTAGGHLTHQHQPQQQQQQPITHQQQPQHSPASTIIKHARSSPRPSQSTAPYPSPSYGHHHHHQNHAQQQQQHHNYSSGTSSNNSSCNNSPNINHTTNTNSANNVFQQLSQQNVTITAHNNSNQQQQQQQQHLSAVTITPNYVTHVQQSQPQQQQPHLRAAASTLTANNIVANNNTQQNQQQQQQQQQHITVQQAVVAAAKHTPNSPNRRTRGENKKCRKVYGMERRDEWCTQCKWKKACTRFGD